MVEKDGKTTNHTGNYQPLHPQEAVRVQQLLGRKTGRAYGWVVTGLNVWNIFYKLIGTAWEIQKPSLPHSVLTNAIQGPHGLFISVSVPSSPKY